MIRSLNPPMPAITPPSPGKVAAAGGAVITTLANSAREPTSEAVLRLVKIPPPLRVDLACFPEGRQGPCLISFHPQLMT